MFKILTISAVLIAVMIGGVLAYASTLPDRFQVQRSLSIRAAPDKIFPLINDLHAFNTWNPFDKKDPSIKGSYSGPASGTGAIYAFESRMAGTGSLEILGAAAPSKVTMRLLMSKPIAADNRVTFTIEPTNDVTRVTWTMDGGMPFVGKLIHLVINMDKMVGNDFESGLADLKTLAERS